MHKLQEWLGRINRAYIEWQLAHVEDIVRNIPAEKAALLAAEDRRHADRLLEIEHEASRRTLEGAQRAVVLRMALR